MGKNIQLREKELHYLQDTDFLKAKLNIQQSIRALLEEAQKNIKLQQVNLSLPAAVWEVPPKISRGENYESLPYLILDYPRIFQQDATFAYRTMLWWGSGFSCTLHLSGTYWQQHQPQILSKLHHLDPQEWWICVNNTPWEYHYRSDNYKLLEDYLKEAQSGNLPQNDFFKISRRLPINSYQELPSFSLETLKKASMILFGNK